MSEEVMAKDEKSVMTAVMNKVYGLVAYGFFVTSFVSYLLYNNYDAQQLVRLPYLIGAAIITFICLFAIHAFAAAENKVGAFLSYTLMAGLEGYMISYIYFAYTFSAIICSLTITAGLFLVASFSGLVCKKDLKGFGGFLVLTCIGLLIAMIVNIFIASAMMDFIISCVAVPLFCGFIMYDTNRLFRNKEEIANSTLCAYSIVVSLYYDILNLFLHVLRLYSRR